MSLSFCISTGWVNLIPLFLSLSLSACSGTSFRTEKIQQTNPEVPKTVMTPVAGSETRWIAPSGGSLLGEGIASLGDVSQPGAWVRAPVLIPEVAEVEIETETVAGPVRIRVEGRGVPGPVQLSLAAYQAMGLSPTALPILRIYAITGDR